MVCSLTLLFFGGFRDRRPVGLAEDCHNLLLAESTLARGLLASEEAVSQKRTDRNTRLGSRALVRRSSQHPGLPSSPNFHFDITTPSRLTCANALACAYALTDLEATRGNHVNVSRSPGGQPRAP